VPAGATLQFPVEQLHACAAEPSHGVVLFKHHQPLQFSQEQLSDLLDASWLWFQASHKLQPLADQPFLLWNCLPRAGASQYHGHAQVR
jgi:galactose-1-phosphate uridylyltransferase